MGPESSSPMRSTKFLPKVFIRLPLLSICDYPYEPKSVRKDSNDRLKLRSAATARRGATEPRMGIRGCLLAQTDASNHRPEPGRASQS